MGEGPGVCECGGVGGVREESAWGRHPPALWDLTDELPQVGSPGKSLEPYHDFIGNCSPPLPSPPCCGPPAPLQASSFRRAPLPSPMAVPGSAPRPHRGGAGSEWRGKKQKLVWGREGSAWVPTERKGTVPRLGQEAHSR